MHLYRLESGSKLGTDGVLQNAVYEFSIDNDNILNVKSSIDNVFAGALSKKRKTTKNDDINLSRAITNAFAKFIKTKFLKNIFEQDQGNVFTLEKLLISIQSNPEPHTSEFIKFLDTELDAFVKNKIDKRGLPIELDRVDVIKLSKYYNRNKPIKLEKVNLYYDPNIEDEIHGGTGNLVCDGAQMLRSLCIEIKSRLPYKEKNLKPSTETNPKARKAEQINTIINSYTDTTPSAILNFIDSIDDLQTRQTLNDIDGIISVLNTDDKFTNYLRNLGNKGGTQGQAKGRGEAAIHMLLNTSNVCSNIEPDAIIKLSDGKELKCSVKSMVSKSAQTGTRQTSSLKKAYAEFRNSLFNNVSNKDITYKSILCVMLNLFLKDEENSAEADKIDLKIKKFQDVTGIELSKTEIDYINKHIENFTINPNTNSQSIIRRYNAFKNEVPKEHDAEYVIIHNSDRFTYLKVKDNPDAWRNIVVSSIGSDNRVNFQISHSPFSKQVESTRITNYRSNDKFENSFESVLSLLCYYLDNPSSYENLEKEAGEEETGEVAAAEEETGEVAAAEEEKFEMSSYKPQGKILKEVYSHLFKKKIIKEGGLAGHMMHPYEALDMTPRQIIDRIKEYSTSQKVIEKVDGQNLFFTVEQDGTLMFARNKEDMTHDDLVAKFTGHGAEKPFVEGGNAIKRGVEQWLQSAGPAAEMEIREVFHPDGETKSFINFEIMHPDKPNQIIYDEKYIVFHSIVDYVDGRKTIHSTNKDQRLEKIIRLMDGGVSSAGFTLASNRTVNLNELTSVQIEDYVERIKEVALSLGIPEDITLGEGIENIIKQEIDNLGIEMGREKLKMLYDFVLYGEDRQGNKIKSKDFTANMLKSDVTGLRSLDLTSSNKALKKVQDIISPFKDVFVDLGVDLLKGVKSAYMSDETNQKNIELLRDKLQTAMNDLIDYMNEKPENYWEAEVLRLRPYLDKVIDKDITNIVATTVEGGVYDYQGDLIKVTGGFAPLNQILGAAYRDKKGIFPTFKEKFMQQESNRRSLKGVFNLIF